MLNSRRAGIKSSLVICFCHKESSRMPTLPELSCRYAGDCFVHPSRWQRSGQVAEVCISSLSSSSVLSTARAQPPLDSAPTLTLIFSPYKASMTAPPPGKALARYFSTVCSSTSNSSCQTLSCPFRDIPAEWCEILSSRIALYTHLPRCSDCAEVTKVHRSREQVQSVLKSN